MSNLEKKKLDLTLAILKKIDSVEPINKIAKIIDKNKKKRKYNKFEYNCSIEIKKSLQNKIDNDTLMKFFELNGIKNYSNLKEIELNISNIKRKINREYYNSDADIVKNQPEVDILITCYNQKEYLKKAIESVLEQNYGNIRIIISDDCSTDGTDEMIYNTFKDNTNIVYSRNEKNMGSSNNLKKLLGLNTGKYFLILDHDDFYINRNFIKQVVSFMEENEKISLGFTNAYFYMQNMECCYRGNFEINDKIFEGEKYFLNFQEKGYPSPISCVGSIFRTSCMDMNTIDKCVQISDHELHLLFMLNGDVKYFDIISGAYRVFGENLSYNTPKKFIINNLKNRKYIGKIAVDKYNIQELAINEWYEKLAMKTLLYYLGNLYKNKEMVNFLYELGCKEIKSKKYIKEFSKSFKLIFIRTFISSLMRFRY